MLAASLKVPMIVEEDKRSRRDEKGSKAVAATSKADDSFSYEEAISEEVDVGQQSDGEEDQIFEIINRFE